MTLLSPEAERRATVHNAYREHRDIARLQRDYMVIISSEVFQAAIHKRLFKRGSTAERLRQKYLRDVRDNLMPGLRLSDERVAHDVALAWKLGRAVFGLLMKAKDDVVEGKLAAFSIARELVETDVDDLVKVGQASPLYAQLTEARPAEAADDRRARP